MATFIVNTATDENDGIGSGSISLRDAIAEANSLSNPGPDIIQFHSSLSGSTIYLTYGELLITEAVTIAGLGANNLTIDAQGTSRVFTINDGDGSADETVEISGLTITGGNVVGSSSSSIGGGILNDENLILSNSTISDNAAQIGGGVFNRRATITLSNSTISGNSSQSGGGGILNNRAMLTLSNSTISGNSSQSGGGMRNLRSSTVIVTSSTISGNSATFSGGIDNNGGSITSLTNSLIAGNSASMGAEIDNNNSTVTANGNNLFGHSGLTYAQAFSGFTPGSTDIVATSDNTSPATHTPTALTNILDTTLHNNGGPTETHALATNSPALDAGDNSQSPGASDQRGELRIVDGPDADTVATIDIGAYEECFLTGTHILSDRGEVPVEDLNIGDLVQTLDGTFQPIKWLGRQTRDPGQIRNPLRGYPIQIKAGALGNDLPHRDLFVSPDHALLFEGLLINAGALVNDISILKTTPTDTFVYHHIELEQHSLLVAEGTAAESYLPQREDRLAYDNGAEYDTLYPNGNKIILWPLDYPRVSSHTTVPRYVRKKLRAIATELSLVPKIA